MPKPIALLARLMPSLAGVMIALHTGLAAAAVPYTIATEPQPATAARIAEDLARYVAPAAGIALGIVPSHGAIENVSRLRYDEGVKFAIVPSDVLEAFADLAARGDRDAGKLVRPLRVIAPLYDEELHFLVRADSPLRFVHELRGHRINLGPVQGAAALSTTTLYRLMFGQPIAADQGTHLALDDALLALARGDGVEVVALVAGQPSPRLAAMGPQARRYLRLLAVDPTHPATRAALRTYTQATLRAASYPGLLDADLPALAVRSFLVTYDYANAVTAGHLARFARSLCAHAGELRERGHPKGREIDLSLPPLGPDWHYYAPTQRALRDCRATPDHPM